MNPLRVVLTWAELEIAAGVGVRRRIRSWAKARTEAFAPDLGDDWGRDIDGAAAEMAYAKAVGTYWSGHVDVFDVPDVGLVDVKHTRRETGDLMLTESKIVDERFYVLVTGKPPTFTIRGMIQGAAARRQEWTRVIHGRPVVTVPVAALTELAR